MDVPTLQCEQNMESVVLCNAPKVAEHNRLAFVKEDGCRLIQIIHGNDGEHRNAKRRRNGRQRMVQARSNNHMRKALCSTCFSQAWEELPMLGRWRQFISCVMYPDSLDGSKNFDCFLQRMATQYTKVERWCESTPFAYKNTCNGTLPKTKK